MRNAVPLNRLSRHMVGLLRKPFCPSVCLSVYLQELDVEWTIQQLTLHRLELFYACIVTKRKQLVPCALDNFGVSAWRHEPPAHPPPPSQPCLLGPRLCLGNFAQHCCRRRTSCSLLVAFAITQTNADVAAAMASRLYFELQYASQ